MSLKIYDRKNACWYEEKQYMQRELTFLYKSRFGRVVLNAFASRRWFSRLYGAQFTARRSVKRIPAFIQRYGIDMTAFEQRDFTSFNDFFVRDFAAGARPVDIRPGMLIAPADAKLTAGVITPDTTLCVKGSRYRLPQLLQDEQVAARYSGGRFLLFRLTADDGHRYCFADDGTMGKCWEIAGRLHTVGPYADGRYRVYSQNHRFCQLLHTRHFGQVACIEVGAMLIGRVVNHAVDSFQKGQEKGFFAYGGSTIILLFQPGRLRVDEDIWQRSRDGWETRVRRGEAIGHG